MIDEMLGSTDENEPLVVRDDPRDARSQLDFI